ncbi:MAG TPA: hypothetical protein GXZ74_08240 [Tissierellia bacterium]|nr:hypothetical protein [Tissierellia bacterium]
MKRLSVCLILLLILLSSCSPDQASPEDTPAEPSPTDEPVAAIETPEAKNPTSESEVPISAEASQAYAVTWTIPTAPKPGYSFAFSLPFDRIELSAKEGRIVYDSAGDYGTYEEGELSNDWTSVHQRPAGYWIADEDLTTDRIDFTVYGEEALVLYEGTILIDQLDAPDGFTIFGARLDEGELIMLPSPVGSSAIITTPEIAPSILGAIAQLKDQAIELASPPWVWQLPPETDPERLAKTPGMEIVEAPKKDTIIYEMVFPTNNFYVELGPVLLWYDATNQTILGQGLRE